MISFPVNPQFPKQSSAQPIFLAWFICALLLMSTPSLANCAETQDVITNSIGMRFVLIKKGTFQMGSSPTQPNHNKDETPRVVVINHDYFLGTTEVTQGQWMQVMAHNPAHFTDKSKKHPVERVSWFDVQRFIKHLKQKEQTHGYRLPTEAEWEYACRARTRTAYYTGRCLSSSQANFDGTRPTAGCSVGIYKEHTTAVASYGPNPWGLFDMHGNVWEWCQDWYHPQSTGGVVDPVSDETARYRVIRGGGWFYLDHDSRSANRDRAAPDLRLEHIGFRLVLEPTRK